MAASIRQSASATGTGATVTATLASTPVVGNTLVVIANSDNSLADPTTSPAWSKRFSYVSDQGFYIWSRPVQASDVTVFTVAPGTTYASLVVLELTGVTSTPFDVVGTVSTVTSAATLAASTITTTAAGDIVLAAYAIHGTNAAAPAGFSYSNGFTSVQETMPPAVASNAKTGLAVAQKIQATAGTVGATSATWTNQGLNIAAVQIAFKAGTTTTAPSTNSGADQSNVEPYSTVTLTAVDTAGTNPITSSGWAQVAGTPVVALNGTNPVTFPAPGTLTGTALRFRRTVSDGTLTGTSETVVTVLPVAERFVVGGAEVPLQIKVVR